MWLSRTTLLIGEEKVNRLKNAHVLVVGLGGVGSFAAEFLCRAGIGHLTIVDGDVVDPSNRNRQLPALSSTHGQSKADLMATRLQDINPDLMLTVRKDFLTPDKAEEICDTPYDYVVDAIDSLTPKLYLINAAHKKGLKIVSSMGAGGKVDPTRIKVGMLDETIICRFSLQIRKRIKDPAIRSALKTVFSDEPYVRTSLMMTDGSNFKKSAYGTISYLPAAFGGTCASVVLRDLLEIPVPMHQSHKRVQRKKKSRPAI